jgi:hypothetical protein
VGASFGAETPSSEHLPGDMDQAYEGYNWPAADEADLPAYNIAMERFNRFCAETHTTPDFFFEKDQALPRRRTSYSFTAFCPNIETLADHLEDVYDNSDQIAYLTWQHEKCPSTGTNHLQGFIKLKGRHQMNFVKQQILKLQDAPVPVGMYLFFHNDDKKAIKYVFKPFSRVDGGYHADLGEYTDRDESLTRTNQAKRSKQAEQKIEIVTKLSQEVDKNEGNILVLMEYPDFLSSFQTLWDTSRAMRAVSKKKERMEKAKKMELRTWQTVLKDELEQDPDDRKVIVYRDSKGGAGKSTFIKYMTDMYPDDTIFMENVKANDAKHVIAKHEHPRNILINLTRTVNDRVGYQVYESIKDGEFTSGKYDSKNIKIDSPTMVFFTNEHLDYTAMSKDRWDIRELIPNPVTKDWDVRRYKGTDDHRLLQELANNEPLAKRQRIE